MATALLARSSVIEQPSGSVVRRQILNDLRQVESYPTLSATAVRAMAMTSSGDVPLVELASIIRRDGVVATAVLRMANGFKHRGRVAVQDIQQAIVRIGLRECGSLLCAIGVRNLSANFDPATRQTCDTLHKHSLFVGCLASDLSKTFALGNPAMAFTAGLLHDIGRIVICATAHEKFHEADPIDFREDDATLPREREHLGIDHCAVGYQFALHNQLPEAIVRVILNHHRPAEELLHPELVALVAFADRIANHIQREHEIAGYDFQTCPFYPFLTDGWTPERQAAFHRALPGVVVRSIKETRKMLKTTA